VCRYRIGNTKANRSYHCTELLRSGLELFMATTFTPNERVLCYHGPLIYEAKVLKAEIWDETNTLIGSTGPHYYVHYKGWKQTSVSSFFFFHHHSPSFSLSKLTDGTNGSQPNDFSNSTNRTSIFKRHWHQQVLLLSRPRPLLGRHIRKDLGVGLRRLAEGVVGEKTGREGQRGAGRR
jgi:hypothetical protein